MSVARTMSITKVRNSRNSSLDKCCKILQSSSFRSLQQVQKIKTALLVVVVVDFSGAHLSLRAQQCCDVRSAAFAIASTPFTVIERPRTESLCCSELIQPHLNKLFHLLILFISRCYSEERCSHECIKFQVPT